MRYKKLFLSVMYVVLGNSAFLGLIITPKVIHQVSRIWDATELDIFDTATYLPTLYATLSLTLSSAVFFGFAVLLIWSGLNLQATRTKE